jgi:uncharacterized protein (UPF0332 family)
VSPDQIALLVRARESLKAAQALMQLGFYNFSVSRSYYSMFYVAQAFLLADEQSFSRHSAVIAAFGQRFAKTGKVPPHFHRHLLEAQDRIHSNLVPHGTKGR